jgi:hypothetical protein
MILSGLKIAVNDPAFGGGSETLAISGTSNGRSVTNARQQPPS